MRYTEDKSDAQYQIEAMTAQSITINKQEYSSSFILAPNEGVQPWPVYAIEEITTETIQPILVLNPDILLIGTGEKSIIIPPRLLAPLYEKNISVECMNTHAACRTYTVLIAENRPVVAAFIMNKISQA